MYINILQHRIEDLNDFKDYSLRICKCASLSGYNLYALLFGFLIGILMFKIVETGEEKRRSLLKSEISLEPKHLFELHEDNLPDLTIQEKIYAIKPEFLFLTAIFIMNILFGALPVILHVIEVPGFTRLVAFVGVGLVLILDGAVFFHKDARDYYFTRRYQKRLLNAQYEKARTPKMNETYFVKQEQTL